MKHFRVPHDWLDARGLPNNIDTFPVLRHMVYSDGNAYVDVDLADGARWGVVFRQTVAVNDGVFV